MSAQLDLLSRATGRRDDPVTAKEAGARAAGNHDRQSLCILRALVALGVPSTGQQIAQRLDGQTGERWDNVKIMRRVAKMRDDGLVYSFDGKAGRPLVRHAGQCCHIATAQGRGAA